MKQFKRLYYLVVIFLLACFLFTGLELLFYFFRYIITGRGPGDFPLFFRYAKMLEKDIP